MTRGKRELSEAIRQLRVHLRESQQTFSNRLGVALRTVARYESERPPRGTVLLRLSQIAEEAGRTDLAAVFERAEEAEKARRESAVASALRELRARTGMTQQALANAIGIAASTVARSETANTPEEDILRRLAAFAQERGLDDISNRLLGEIVRERFDNLRLGPGTLFSLAKYPGKRQHLPSFEANLIPRPGHAELRAAEWLLSQNDDLFTAVFREFVVNGIEGMLRQGRQLTSEESEMLGELATEAIEQFEWHGKALREEVSIGIAIGQLREELSLSEQQLAAELGVGTEVLKRYESDQASPSAPELLRLRELATEHRLPIRHLFGWFSEEAGYTPFDYDDTDRFAVRSDYANRLVLHERDNLRARVAELEQRLQGEQRTADERNLAGASEQKPEGKDRLT